MIYDIKNMRTFFDTAWERHRIYVLKSLGYEKPWTKDKIYQRYYFCNVFRSLDKTSQYLIELIKKNEHRPDLWKTIMLFRYISRLSTYEKLKGHEFDFKWMYHKLWDMKRAGDTVFTGAFILSSAKDKSKINYIFSLLTHIEGYLIPFDETLQKTQSIKEICNGIIYLPGIGPFMAYQYCMDFLYSSRYMRNVTDKYTWTILGKGAVRGMNRILFNKPKSPSSLYLQKSRALYDLDFANDVFLYWLQEIVDNLNKEIIKTYNIVRKVTDYNGISGMISDLYKPFRKLHMGNVEHWLCEYDKYCRGYFKRVYRGV